MLRRYLLIPVFIGVFVGLMAVLFVWSLELISHFALENLVGYYAPKPAGEGPSEGYTPSPLRPYLLPLVVAVGGFISGLITYLVDPRSAGVGTDAAIRAYHRGEKLSLLTSLSKLITSAVTIGTGGTSGREGPIALIGAGVGSWTARLFKLDPKDRRIALAVGLGAGVAAIFKAPLAGAIISAEVFFKKDFEIEAMIPSFVASVTSYSVFGLFFGFQPIFSTQIPPFTFEQAKHLFFYAVLGVICAVFVRAFVFFFFQVSDFFKRSTVHPLAKPLLGGLIAGTVGALIPPAIGNGYGWLQLIMDGEINDPLLPLIWALGVVLGVSFTLGSGMSGGVFGPSVMIGGLIGSAFSMGLNTFADTDLSVTSFAVVGMVSFFAGAAKAPLSTLILIAEMTGGYQLLVPAMVSVFFSYFLSGKESIFPSQVDTRLDSPAHAEEWGLLILDRLKVKDYMKDPIVVDPNLSVEDCIKLMGEKLVGGFPVVSKGRLVGIVTKSDLLSVPERERTTKKVYQVMTPNPVTIRPENTLGEALRIMWTKGVGRLPVVDRGDPKKLLGIIARADLGRAIREFGSS